MSISLSAFTEELRDLYANGALYESYVAQFKTADELCMIKASTAARQPQRFKEDVRNGIPFRALFIDQNYAQAAYLHEEVKFYELLMINAADGEMPGGVDFVWINDDVESCELAKEFKRNAALLEKSCIGTSSPKPCCLVILDPFLCSFSVERSLLLETPAESPVAALSSAISSIKPGSLETWNHAINSFNKSMASNDTAPFDTREILLLEQAHETSSIKYSCWLPTDFYVSKSGSVTIRSYINNLHPIQHAGLYECISKVFAKFVPLLEQVATDVLHPPKPRTVFDQEDWYMPGMLHPDAIIEMLKQGNPVPEEYRQFVTSSSAYCHGGQGNITLRVNDTELDMTALFKAWEAVMSDAKHYTPPFVIPDRPIEPYSVCGMSLQASVEMVAINLTPEHPRVFNNRWRAVGRAEERIFAIGLYFYDVENIGSARIMFLDPVAGKEFNDSYEMQKFCSVLKIRGDTTRKCEYSQEVGSVEIESGRYVCYPNLYKTVMPHFSLADPTKPGHVKFIAFYIADPTTRLVSTEIVPPQQPGWAKTNEPGDNGITCKEVEELRLAHANHSYNVEQRFEVCLAVRED